jgi:hypothetical protein
MGHPDDDVQSKYKLLLQALELLVGGPRTIVPAGVAAAIWLDFCCIDQRASPSQVTNTWVRSEDCGDGGPRPYHDPCG